MALPGPARVNEPAFGKGGGGGRKNFLDLADLAPATLREILDLGAAFKRGAPPGGDPAPLAGKTLAMIFEKPSTRTRVSFEVGMRQLGGEVVIMSHSESQLGRGETIADTARVLSRYVDVIMLRTVNVAHLNDMAQYATVPVINGLSDRSHPCQLMADIMTFEERLGPIAGRVVAWSGDGNNVAASWIEAAVRFGFTLRLACPEAFRPPACSTGPLPSAATLPSPSIPRTPFPGPTASSPTPGCRWALEPGALERGALEPGALEPGRIGPGRSVSNY